jgi:uncharacterized membrane protein YtjA (UPF0391 family)
VFKKSAPVLIPVFTLMVNSIFHLKIITMLRWTVIFLVVAIIAAVFGFTGIAAGAASIAKILFFIFIILFLISLVAGGFRRVD